VQIESLLEESARRAPHKVALVCGSTRRTYAELDREADRLAHAFVEMGVESGDRIAICLENGPEAVVSMFGAWKAGAAIVPVNPMTKAEKLGRVLEDSGARAIVISDRKLEGLARLRHPLDRFGGALRAELELWPAAGAAR
jgi:acyl-CoA synthetase (AMP-forming)/AMP-acid ligase II